MGRILMDLTDLLGCKVDLVESVGLKDFARESVERDKILIYERSDFNIIERTFNAVDALLMKR